MNFLDQKHPVSILEPEKLFTARWSNLERIERQLQKRNPSRWKRVMGEVGFFSADWTGGAFLGAAITGPIVLAFVALVALAVMVVARMFHYRDHEGMMDAIEEAAADMRRACSASISPPSNPAATRAGSDR